MSVSLYSADELANVSLYLMMDRPDQFWRATEWLTEWSRANTRAYNEQYHEVVSSLGVRAIFMAWKDPNFRYDRKRAKASLELMSYNVITNDGRGPEDFESFDYAGYTQALAKIMERAFGRLMDETRDE